MELYRTHISPPTPKLTEKNLPDQEGKVFFITGANAGVGKQLATIVYSKNAKVYVAARSMEKLSKATEKMKAAHPNSKGELVPIHLDLADLTTIKKSADEFLALESKLDVLWLNAGVMAPPQGSKTAQGYELQLGTNNLGHFLLVKYLHPTLSEAAKAAPPATVRVVWVSSSIAEMAPKPPIDFENMDYHKDEAPYTKYGRSKAGNVIHAVEFAKRTKGEGIISVSLNPGNLRSDLQRHSNRIMMAALSPMLHDPIFGAYTELWAGLSPEITEEQNAAWIQPWGRIRPIREDLADPELGRKYWEWSEEQVKDY